MTIEPSSLQDHANRALAASLAERIDRPVVMVGMMGVGKTSVGRKLAQLLQLRFTDADEEIERAARMSVAEIFDGFGEPYFRDGERRVIARLMDEGPSVIATGGGAFVAEETRTLILQRGTAVWLDCDVPTLVERVTRKDTRPLLRGGDPAAIVTRLKAERERFYAEAPIKVISGGGPQGETVRRVLEAIEQWL